MCRSDVQILWLMSWKVRNYQVVGVPKGQNSEIIHWPHVVLCALVVSAISSNQCFCIFYLCLNCVPVSSHQGQDFISEYELLSSTQFIQLHSISPPWDNRLMWWWDQWRQPCSAVQHHSGCCNKTVFHAWCQVPIHFNVYLQIAMKLMMFCWSGMKTNPSIWMMTSIYLSSIWSSLRYAQCVPRHIEQVRDIWVHSLFLTWLVLIKSFWFHLDYVMVTLCRLALWGFSKENPL